MVKSGSYSGVMAAQCSKYGMKPVCDHPSYCQNDKNALYIGQQGHTAYPGPPRPEAPSRDPSPPSLCVCPCFPSGVPKQQQHCNVLRLS